MQRGDQAGGVLSHPPDRQHPWAQRRAPDALVVEHDHAVVRSRDAVQERRRPAVHRPGQALDEHDRPPGAERAVADALLGGDADGLRRRCRGHACRVRGRRRERHQRRGRGKGEPSHRCAGPPS
jgi:hypothetical protein